MFTIAYLLSLRSSLLPQEWPELVSKYSRWTFLLSMLICFQRWFHQTPVSLDQAEFTQQVPQLNHLFLVCLNKKKREREKEIPGKGNISENDGCLLFRFNFIWTIWVGYSRAARWLNMPSECGQCLGHALCSRHPKNYSWPSFSLPITAGCPYITFFH